MSEGGTDHKSKKDETLKKTRDKFLACVFMDGLSKKQFRRHLGDLNNSIFVEANEGTLNYISHCVDNDGKKDMNQVMDSVAFTQVIIGLNRKKFPKIE